MRAQLFIQVTLYQEYPQRWPLCVPSGSSRCGSTFLSPPPKRTVQISSAICSAFDPQGYKDGEDAGQRFSPIQNRVDCERASLQNAVAKSNPNTIERMATTLLGCQDATVEVNFDCNVELKLSVVQLTISFYQRASNGRRFGKMTHSSSTPISPTRF